MLSACRWLVVGLLGIAAGATAHRAPGSLTTIEWNPQSGRTEIVHRLHSHDAELGIGEVAGEPDLSVLSLEGRATIALYVEERFAIVHGDSNLAIDLVGAELVSDYVYVYQEVPERLAGTIRLRNEILRDVFPAQVNQVNIADGGIVRTLAFSDDDTWHDYVFGGSGT